ncbi:APC family permease [Sporosarcina sp. HYO08]|uniref:APC family permease n=1 Tax=Sporosarcina sp. HYO08 TaxID=1759557 RepID=UPI000791B77F|nr:APC family permease [Sporosarcina sp. HYO08]KXH84061.1 amino acid permease [Sporosarcina sp. HYO08]
MEKRVELEKTYKPQWVWAIALGSAIGWGAFILPTEWMNIAGPVGTVIGLGVGAILMMIISVSYGVLIEKYPVSGGEFAYTYLKFGRVHAFVCGWFLTLAYICIVALNASAMALLGKFLFPSITNVVPLYEIGGWQVYLGEVIIATFFLLLFAFLNIKGASLSGSMQYIFCIILVGGVVLLTIAMFMSPATSLTNITPMFKPEVPPLKGILAVLVIAPWAYVGFNNIPQAAEEFDFPAKKAFSLIIYSLIFAFILYAFMILATAVAVPWQNLVAGQPAWGTGDVVSDNLGAAGVFMLAIALCMGVFTGLNGFFSSASRLLFAMGRAKIVPSTFAKLHPKYGTPYVGIMFTAVFCLAAPWFGRPVLLWIVDMSAVGVTIAYFYACLTAYKLFKWSRSNATDTREVSPYKKIMALLGTASGLAFLGLLLVPGTSSALGVESFIALGVWVLLGATFYLAKRKELHAIPKSTLDYYILGKTISEEEALGVASGEGAIDPNKETPPVQLT